MLKGVKYLYIFIYYIYMSLVILPHQLYDKKYIDKNYKIVLYEHPHYFKKYNYNKKRLMLHFATMEYYKDYLKENGYKVRLIKYNKKFTLKSYDIFDPIDKIKLEGEPNILESPNFLLKMMNYEQYRKKTDKFFFNSFYMWGKKIIDVIPNVKSQDKDNRKKLPKNLEDT